MWTVSIVILSLSVIEHLFSIQKLLYDTKACGKSTDATKAMFLIAFPELFYFAKYTLWLAIWARFTQTISTFVWSYMDLFVTLISVGLFTRFKQIYLQLKAVKGMVWYILFTF